MDNIELTEEHLKQARAVVSELALDMDDREIIAKLREIAIWGTENLIDQFRAELTSEQSTQH